MNPTEVAALLTVISTYDRRPIAEADVHAWHAAMQDIDYVAARDAVVRHYATETAWVMPAHIRKLAVKASNDRHDRAALDTPRHGDGRHGKPEWFDEVAAAHRANWSDHWDAVWARIPSRPERKTWIA